MTNSEFKAVQVLTHLKVAAAAISEAQQYRVDGLDKPLKLIQIQIANAKLFMPEVQVDK